MNKCENGSVVTLIPLVPNVVLPEPASPRTRTSIPPGKGVQEECLPFTAASALGFLIKSPITFGICLPGEVPEQAHKFRSPLDRSDARVFYVMDNPNCRFRGNAYEFEDIPVKQPTAIREPGISFFDRT